MDLIEKINRTAFLGSEFLTYLWFMSETSGEGYLSDPDEERFEVVFDDRLTVGGAQVNAQENLFRGGHPTSSLEAHAALRLGKLATEARVRIQRGAQEWAFILKSADLSISALQVPSVLSKKDDDRFYERMYLVEELEKMLNFLYKRFLAARLSEAWSDELLPDIRKWVGTASSPNDGEARSSNENASAMVQFDVSSEVIGDRPPWETSPEEQED